MESNDTKIPTDNPNKKSNKMKIVSDSRRRKVSLEEAITLSSGDEEDNNTSKSKTVKKWQKLQKIHPGPPPINFNSDTMPDPDSFNATSEILISNTTTLPTIRNNFNNSFLKQEAPNFLKTVVYYKGVDETSVIYRYVNCRLVLHQCKNLLLSIYNNTNSPMNICPNVPVQIIFPFELDCTALSNLLLYFHGHQLLDGTSDDKSYLQKLYVAAKYLGCDDKLLEDLRMKLGAKSGGNAIAKLDEFAGKIVKTMFFAQHVVVSHVSQLPKS